MKAALFGALVTGAVLVAAWAMAWFGAGMHRRYPAAVRRATRDDPVIAVIRERMRQMGYRVVTVEPVPGRQLEFRAFVSAPAHNITVTFKVTELEAATTGPAP